ncbi:MAG TPA: tetratricopeptide repeat protein [Bacteroidetes bacterium]|nr:tetratricopeptide repeat protein [Bacteroidota bacterium]
MKTAQKQVILAIVFCLFGSSVLSAQSPLLDVGANFGAGFPVGNSKYFNSYAAPTVRLYLIYNYFTNFNLKFQFGYGKIGKIYQNKTRWISVKNADLLGIYSFPVGGYFRPFLQIGFGLINYDDKNAANFNEGAFIGSIGMRMPLNPNLSIIMAADLRSPFGDDYSGIFSGLEDIFFSFQSGFVYHFKKTARSGEKKFDPRLVIGNGRPEKGVKITVNPADLEETMKNMAKVKAQIVRQLDSMIVIQDEMIDALADKVKMLLQEKNQLTEVPKEVPAKQQPNENYLQIGGDYQLALNNYNEKNFKAAILILSDLRKRFPFHPLVSNFIYWTGESYYALKNYAAAIAAFSEVENYEISAKKDDSLLMSGICYTKLGDYKKANAMFQKLIRHYPQSEYVDKTKMYLSLLDRKVIY